MPGATITRGFLPACAEKTSGQLFPLLCLAPHGVFRATSLTRKSGGLLPRLFTLTQLLGGLFSVTLSVTRDLHPRYPRFHEACRLPVFGLSSGEKLSSQRSPATFGILPSKRSQIQPRPKTAPFAFGVMASTRCKPVYVLSVMSQSWCRRRDVSAYRKESDVTLDLDSIRIHQSRSSIRSSLLRPHAHAGIGT
jgi:hypothetical protein